MKKIVQRKELFEAVCERDIAIIFVEEVCSCPDFRKQLVDTLSQSSCKISNFVGAWHKVKDYNLGSVDILMLFDTNKGRRCAILFENIIEEEKQALQSEKYFEIGELGKKQGLWQDYITCLFAPKKYFSSLKPEQFFSSYLSYEEFGSRIKELSKDKNRTSFKLRLLRQAIEQVSQEEEILSDKEEKKEKYSDYKIFPGGAMNLPEGYMLAKMEKASPFAQDYLSFCQEKFPDLGIMRHGKGSRDDIEWVQFKPSFFEEGVSIIHKMPQGAMDLSFSNKSSQEIYDRFSPYLSAEMEIKEIGEKTVIRTNVPAIKNVNSFLSIKDIVGFSLFKARRMAELYKKLSKKSSSESVSTGEGGFGTNENQGLSSQAPLGSANLLTSEMSGGGNGK